MYLPTLFKVPFDKIKQLDNFLRMSFLSLKNNDALAPLLYPFQLYMDTIYILYCLVRDFISPLITAVKVLLYPYKLLFLRLIHFRLTHKTVVGIILLTLLAMSATAACYYLFLNHSAALFMATKAAFLLYSVSNFIAYTYFCFQPIIEGILVSKVFKGLVSLWPVKKKYFANPVEALPELNLVDAKSCLKYALTTQDNVNLSAELVTQCQLYFGKGKLEDGTKVFHFNLILHRLGLIQDLHDISRDIIGIDHLRILLIQLHLNIETDPHNIHRWSKFVCPVEGFGFAGVDIQSPLHVKEFAIFFKEVVDNPILTQRLKMLFCQNIVSFLPTWIKPILNDVILNQITPNDIRIRREKNYGLFLNTLKKVRKSTQYLHNAFIEPEQKIYQQLNFDAQQMKTISRYAANYLLAKTVAYLNIFPGDVDSHEWEMPLYSFDDKNYCVHKIHSVRQSDTICHVARPQDQRTLLSDTIDILVFFAGSTCLNNFLDTNLQVSPGRETLSNGFALQILQMIEDAIENYPSHTDDGVPYKFNIHINGHSLGGALSMSLCVDLMKSILMSRSNGGGEELAFTHVQKKDNAFKNKQILKREIAQLGKHFTHEMKKQIEFAYNIGCAVNQQGIYEHDFANFNHVTKISGIYVNTCNSPGITKEEASESCALALLLNPRSEMPYDLEERPNAITLSCQNIKVEGDLVQQSHYGHLFNYLESKHALLEVMKFEKPSTSWSPLSSHRCDIFDGEVLPPFTMLSNAHIQFKANSMSIRSVIDANPIETTNELLYQNPLFRNIVRPLEIFVRKKDETERVKVITRTPSPYIRVTPVPRPR